MPPPGTDRCASCQAEGRNMVHLALKLDGLESWIILPHCANCLDADTATAQRTARRVIDAKRERAAAKKRLEQSAKQAPQR